MFPSSNYEKILFIVTLLLWMVSSPLIKAQNLRLKWCCCLKNTVVHVCASGKQKQNPHYFQGEKIAGIGVWKDIRLVSSHKLVEETDVIFREETQVFDLVFQVGDTFHTHTEGIAFVDGGVDAVGFQHCGVYHTATENFHPASVFAESTAITCTNVAGDVHFGRRLCEGEIRGTQADLRVGTKHFSCEGEEHLFQVGERHIFVDVQAFHLVEKAVCASRNRFVAQRTHH